MFNNKQGKEGASIWILLITSGIALLLLKVGGIALLVTAIFSNPIFLIGAVFVVMMFVLMKRR